MEVDKDDRLVMRNRSLANPKNSKEKLSKKNTLQKAHREYVRV